jgi:WD40 repeat protein
VSSLAFSLDGEYIVSGSWDETIRIWDSRTSSTVCGPFIGHTQVVGCVQFSPEGGYVVSAACVRTVRTWNV